MRPDALQARFARVLEFTNVRCEAECQDEGPDLEYAHARALEAAVQLGWERREVLRGRRLPPWSVAELNWEGHADVG